MMKIRSNTPNQELQEFSANPDAEKFQGATRKAEAIRESKIKNAADSARKQVNVPRYLESAFYQPLSGDIVADWRLRGRLSVYAD